MAIEPNCGKLSLFVLALTLRCIVVWVPIQRNLTPS